ncbi:MAG TPA: WS/DGAT domain-containing protein [Thermomonospora sp.]|nr:WS/DGAT domain-containing protein [Thermomonospora sp.]
MTLNDPPTLTPLDALFVAQQRRLGAPTTCGALVRLGGEPPTVEELAKAMAGRSFLEHPRMRAVLDTRSGRARWRTTGPVDPLDHISVIQTGPGEEALRRVFADLLARRIDGTCPPWRMDLVTGYSTEEFSLIIRFDHALGDGVSAGLVLLELATGTTIASMDAPVPVRGSLRGLVSALWSFRVPGPSLPINRRIGPGRHVAWARVPREVAEAARDVPTPLGRPTLNDVYLAAVAGALRRVLTCSGGGRRPPRRAFGLVPVDLRAPGRELSLGNCLSVMRVPLPLREPDPAARMAAVRAAVAAAQRRGHAPALALLARGAGLAGLTGSALLVRLLYHPRLVNLICSNIPIPDGRHTFLGRPVLDVCATTILPGRHGLSLGLHGYADMVTVTIVADAAMADTADLLARELENEFYALAGPPA